jgi:hypothetical protein
MAADAIVVFGSDSDVRLSHDVAADAGARPDHQIATATIGAASTSVLVRMLILTIPPSCLSRPT